MGFPSRRHTTTPEEPVWAGPVKNLIDPFGYGGYYINVYDKAGKELIYSRGFNTLFEEWRSTEQAKTETQSWTNSISIPYPKAPVIIEITARDKADMQFHPLLKQEIDPASIFIDRGNSRKTESQKSNITGIPPEESRPRILSGRLYSGRAREICS